MTNKCFQSGRCCKIFLINLTEEEYKSGKYKTHGSEFGITEDFKEAEISGANTLEQKEDGSCVYLKDNKCSIHATRPKVCRAFFCTSKEEKFQDMIKMVNEVK
jgi:Fe-S-cluster containining protein